MALGRLILSRRPQERIMIGDDITLTVIEVRDGRVRFMIEAPQEVPIHREEVYKRVLKEQEDGK